MIEGRHQLRVCKVSTKITNAVKGNLDSRRYTERRKGILLLERTILGLHSPINIREKSRSGDVSAMRHLSITGGKQEEREERLNGLKRNRS